MNIILAAVTGYIIGSIPWALVIGIVFYKTDIRQHGSGNLGGTNAGRVLGKTAGAVVSVLDVLKSVLAMVIVSWIDPSQVGIAGFAAAFGHCFPLFAKFKGGKAVATIIGFLLGMGLYSLIPIWVFVVNVIAFFTILKVTKMVSLSSMSSIAIGLLVSFWFDVELLYRVFHAILLVLTVVRHRDNITRIIKGTESKVKWL